MRIETHGQQIEVTPALRDYIETKLARLSRHFDQPLEVRTQLSLDKPDHMAEATVNVSGRTLHADAHVVDGAVNGAGELVRGTAGQVRKLQSGNVRNYAAAIAAGVVVLLMWFVVVRGLL